MFIKFTKFAFFWDGKEARFLFLFSKKKMKGFVKLIDKEKIII